MNFGLWRRKLKGRRILSYIYVNSVSSEDLPPKQLYQLKFFFTLNNFDTKISMIGIIPRENSFDQAISVEVRKKCFQYVLISQDLDILGHPKPRYKYHVKNERITRTWKTRTSDNSVGLRRKK